MARLSMKGLGFVLRFSLGFGLRFIWAICWALLVIPHSEARADGLEIAFFNIEHDAETGALDIVHRFFLQDIEIALNETTGQAINLDDLAALDSVVRRYIEARFSLTTPDGLAMKARWDGVERRAGTLLIRQRATLPDSAKGLVVHNAALHETHPKHVNIMHATVGGKTLKRDFLAGGIPQKLVIE